jgi:hypothetical protein
MNADKEGMNADGILCAFGARKTASALICGYLRSSAVILSLFCLLD